MAKVLMRAKSNLQNGVHEISPFKAPSTLTKGEFIFKLLMNKVDLQDTSMTIKVATYLSDDGISWQSFVWFTYIGEIYPLPEGVTENIPGFITRIDNWKFADKQFKAVIDINKTVEVGAEVEWL